MTNEEIIERLQKENAELKAELAPFRQMKNEYERYYKENKGNDTIVRDENGHISVIFGEGKVLLSIMDASLTRDNAPVHGIVLSALKEEHKKGVDLYNGKCVPDLAKEGIIYPTSIVLVFKDAEGAKVLEEFTKEVKNRFATDIQNKGA